MIEWTIQRIELPLKFPWKIARGTSHHKINFVVKASCNGQEGLGEVAFNVRYNESEELILDGFKQFVDAGAAGLTSLEKLIFLVNELELPASLRFGIESAMAHLDAVMTDRSIHKLLCMPQVHGVKTSFSLPIMDPSEVEAFIREHNLTRFSALKLKLGEQGAADFVHEVRRHYSGPLRLDANEAFVSDGDYMKLCESIKDLPIQFIEQPFVAKEYELYRSVRNASPFPIFADESVTDGDITPVYKELFHGINVKLMKAGGYMRALKQLRSARELGMSTMLGCMVETSLGISSAMNLAAHVDYFDLDGCLLISKDPFNAVTEEGGVLKYNYVV